MTETIVAMATPPGHGGVGIVRVSGPRAQAIAALVTHQALRPRVATYTPFYSSADTPIDEGLAILFTAPNSFTGEDVLELQGHGGPVVMDQLIAECLQHGARLARPGEFSERAFLNDKLDLVQAEAIADLINATTTQAAQSAMRSLQGEFSEAINQLLEQLIKLRMFIESAIDFTDEDIDFVEQHQIIEQLQALQAQLKVIRQQAQQGALLQSGIQVVIAGAPNAGKSSLLNCLSGRDAAIVTAQAGTTRDVLREHIQVDGLPLHIIDTAGIRDTDDLIEKEGVKRAHQAIKSADLILWVYDASQSVGDAPMFPSGVPLIEVRNKVDLVQGDDIVAKHEQATVVSVSALRHQHIDQLKAAIKDAVGFQSAESSGFMARRRHLDAIDRTCEAINHGVAVYQSRGAHELLAQDLREASEALSEITGVFTSDDLLGKIFSEFCIGK